MILLLSYYYILKINRMDIKITRFGYIINKKSLSDEMLSEIRNDLSLEPETLEAYSKFKKNRVIKLFLENGDYIGIPKYYGIIKFGCPKLNKLELYNYPKYNMQYIGKLRPNQEKIVENIVQGFNKDRGGILIAGCGSGKTNIAIYLACKYKLKTLFIVHKKFLKNQAIDRIKCFTNVKDIGIIQRNKVEVNYPFVIGMIQSLSKRNYDDLIFRDFGMIIIDEVHHMGARNFSRFFQKSSAKYMLGITAERYRKDGMFKIINWYMGPILHDENQKPNDMVVIKKFYYKTNYPNASQTIINRYTNQADQSSMISALINIKKRNHMILNIILDLFDQGKNILVLTGRLSQIDLFSKILFENIYTRNHVGEYVGKMSEHDLQISSTKQIILATYEMAQEGLDIPELNVVIFATPKKDIQQSLGRILRKEENFEHPIAIDIVDDYNSIYTSKSYFRDKYYYQQKHHVQKYRISDYQIDNYIMSDDLNAIHEALIKLPNVNDKKKIINTPLEDEIINFID